MNEAGEGEGSRLITREVVIGRNSAVWKAASAHAQVAAGFVAIGHAELGSFVFAHTDRVWIFSYSGVAADNTRMLQVLKAAEVGEVVYVSTATTNVVTLTRCYGYPTVKALAEQEARDLLGARILTLGIVAKRLEDLPAGRNAATLQAEIDSFLLAPHWPHDGGRRMRLFEIRARPFVRGWERPLHRVYDSVQWMFRRWPCILRPADLLLRMSGIRWYGYVNLSNRLWITTTS